MVGSSELPLNSLREFGSFYGSTSQLKLVGHLRSGAKTLQRVGARSTSGEPVAVADIEDLEVQAAEHTSCTVYAAVEVVRTEWTAGRVQVGDAENGLGVVTFAVEDQQIGGGAAEMMSREELKLSSPVILGCCLQDVLALNWIPESHQ